MTANVKIFVLAVVLQGCLADPQFINLSPETTVTEPKVPGWSNRHYVYTDLLGMNGEPVFSNKDYRVAARYVQRFDHPIGTGEVLGKQVETIAIGNQQAQSQVSVHPHVYRQELVRTVPVVQPVQTVQTQLVQQVVPAQTVQQVVPAQTVQVVQPQYQVVAPVPAPAVQVQREIVEVEKPVPVPQPVPVQEPPKPFIKESVYVRPFQVAVPYVKTRITPIEKNETGENRKRDKEPPHITTTPSPPLESTPEPGTPAFEEVIEERLFYVNKKKKIVTKFIKVVEVYDVEATEPVGTYYHADVTGNNYELQVTEIYEADRPFLVRNSTSTKQIPVDAHHPVRPKHYIYEYENNILVHSYAAHDVHTSFGGVHPNKTHFERFHGITTSGSHGNFGHLADLNVKTYTRQSKSGRDEKVTERSYELPGGQAVLVEQLVSNTFDNSPFPEHVKPIPSFEETVDKATGKRMQKIVLTYDATDKQNYDPTYGYSARADFISQFKNFLASIQGYFQHIIEQSHTSTNRAKRSASDQIMYHGKTFRKVEEPSTKSGGDVYHSEDGEKVKVEEEHLTHIQGTPRNEYLRYGRVYVPKMKVKYEVVGLHPDGYYGNEQAYGFPPYSSLRSGTFQGTPFDLNNYSYRYTYPQYNHPFYYV